MADGLNAALERVGRRIAASQDAQIDAVVEAARAGIEARSSTAASKTPSKSSSKSSSSSRRVLLLAAATTTLAIAAALFLFIRSRGGEGSGAPASASTSLAFEVAASQGVVGAPVRSPAASDLPLRFSDGTTVLLGRETEAKVIEVTANGARVAIQRGRAIVAVRARSSASSASSARWSFDVGPFTVATPRSHATTFTTSWDVIEGLFDLELHDGDVEVSGPTIAGRRAVAAGQTLHIAVKIDGESLDERSSPPPRPSTAPAGAPAPAPAPAPSWKALSVDGKYAEALSVATKEFDSITSHGSADDVMMLGDTARLAGDAQRAKRAYVAARQRLPGSNQAALAAFTLGRMAAQTGDEVDATRWFDTFLSERPNDRLAREAMGRSMELLDKRGETTRARSLADQYSTKYPDGPHVKLARKIKGD